MVVYRKQRLVQKRINFGDNASQTVVIKASRTGGRVHKSAFVRYPSRKFHKCEACGEGFGTIRALKRHYTTKHKHHIRRVISA